MIRKATCYVDDDGGRHDTAADAANTNRYRRLVNVFGKSGDPSIRDRRGEIATAVARYRQDIFEIFADYDAEIAAAEAAVEFDKTAGDDVRVAPDGDVLVKYRPTKRRRAKK